MFGFSRLIKKSYFAVNSANLMILSVIIVNYNAKYFLEQCLCSLIKALGILREKFPGQETEIILVDNHSTDSSPEFISMRFPDIKSFFNPENLGFSRANNQALKEAKGDYVLFLNPDTIIPETSLMDCISFLEKNLRSGAAGVRMIDGSGKYLKESKRGFPSPWAAACKIIGLAALFPHSKFFAEYYMGNLSEKENNPVDVLSGAFMMVRRKILLNLGGFDEQFFMYAEDIDLSLRIQKAGFSNDYLASICIIHFKGESTVKNVQYNQQFYQAMQLFVKKHFRSPASPFFNPLINISIWFAAQASRLIHFFKPAWHPGQVRSIKSFLEGNADNVEQIKNVLNSSGRQLVGEMDAANEIVFLEGKSITYEEIIGQMQTRGKKYSFKIRGNESQSIVGSYSKDEPGEFIILS